MTRDSINNEYFNWLFDLVSNKKYSDRVSYRKLLMRLHDIRFTYQIERDENRSQDGEELRYRFAVDMGYEDSADLILEYLDRPCTVLEMMTALAIRCEKDIMDDPSIGDRTRQWFWGMIVNLGLGSMDDAHFNRRHVDDCVYRFLDREYEPDGRGGLFFIRDCDQDLRDVEIWYQLCWYLNSIT